MSEDLFDHNPAFEGMDTQKLEFLKSFANMKKPQNINQAMPLLLAQMNLAKKQNISFSRPEVALIIELLSQNLSPADKERVNKMMQIMKF